MSKKFISSVWDFSEVTSTETGYVTHDFLRWYGKLIPQLVSRVITMYSSPGESVLANFSGSGTVALEAHLLARNVIGIDANPLSLLVSRVKANPYQSGLAENLEELEKTFVEGKALQLDGLGALSKWFHKGQDEELVALRRAIDKLENVDLRDTLKLALASIVKKVSLVDSRCVNHLVTDKFKPELNVWNTFRSKVISMGKSIDDLNMLAASSSTVEIVQGDARNLPLGNSSVDLVVSHPPYLGAIDYSNMYQLENAVLGFEHSTFKASDISTNSMKKYLESMQEVFSEMYRVSKVGGRIVVIIGDNRKDGLIQPTFAHFIVDAETRLGLKLEDTFIWVTSGKAGMSVKRHGNYIDHNYVLVFRK